MSSSNNVSKQYNYSTGNRNQSGFNRSAVNTNSGVSARVPCCPHCSNVNKFSKTDTILPTDHFLRETPSPDSKLVCPVLLATECRYCKQLGHTISKCPIIAENKKRDSEMECNMQQRNCQKQSESKSTPISFRSNNAFGVLDSDSDDEVKPKHVAKTNRTVMGSSNIMGSNKRKRDESQKEKIQFDFPPLESELIISNQSKCDQLKCDMNFADAIKKEAPVVEKPVTVLPPMLTPITKQQPQSMGIFKKVHTNWADSDSEDEYSESDRQRIAAEHKLWIESRTAKIIQPDKIIQPVLSEINTVDSW